MAYAKDTSVSVDNSRAEIEKILGRYGASKFGYVSDSERGIAMIEFYAQARHIRFVLHLPSMDERQFTHTPTGIGRHRDDVQRQWEQACRSRWRALVLCIKAKLEAVESGITEFETEFLAHIVLPGHRTVGELMRPQIAQAYLSGEAPTGIAGYLPSPEEPELSDIAR